MNKLIALASLGFVAFAMTACSDDDEPSNNTPAEPSIDNVFTAGLPASVDGTTFTTNSKGQVTKIVDGSEVVTFEYGAFSKATEFNALMKIRDTDYPEDGSDIYMQLNSDGFVTYALQVYLDSEDSDDTWHFEYNADGQLTSLKRSEGGDTYKITYSNGDITKVYHDEEEDGYHSECTFSYTNSEFKTAIPNKGNIMLFDEFFSVDMDEMGIAYFAGLLGKSTKNLPMSCIEKYYEGDYSDTYTEIYRWTFNANNLPTKFWYDGQGYTTVSFSW